MIKTTNYFKIFLMRNLEVFKIKIVCSKTEVTRLPSTKSLYLNVKISLIVYQILFLAQ